MNLNPIVAATALVLGVVSSLTHGQSADETTTPRTILLVDDHAILYRAGVKRVLRPLDRHPQNPLLEDDKLWEKTIAYCSVHRNSDTGLYQLWYQALASISPEATNVCYAESKDGVHWHKPNLGLVSFDGIKETNIVIHGGRGYGASVVHDPREKDAAKRYKMARFEMPDGYDSKSAGLYIYCSPDGIHWSRHPAGPLLPGSFGKSMDPPFRGQRDFQMGRPLSVSDVIDAMYDPLRDSFAIYAKTWLDGPDGKMFWKRAVVRTESNDFVHWTKPQLMMAPDEFDGTGVEYRSPIQRGIKGKVHAGRRGTQLHSGPAFFCKDVYFSLLQVMDGEITGEMPIELAISRDGLDWCRPFRREPFLDVSKDRDRFDGGCIWSNATPVILDDEMRFYYGAYSGLWNGTLIKRPTGVGLATMPLDRFVGLRTVDGIGQITFKPMPLPEFERGITLNADASGGSILAEVLTEDGYRLKGSVKGRTSPVYTKELCVPIKGDSLRHQIRWKHTNMSFETLPPGRYMLRLYLKNAEVFAVNVL